MNEIYKNEHSSNKKISELNSNHYNRTDGMSDQFRYGIIKYNRKENTFIIINSNKTMIYDSRVGFLDLKALSLKDESGREDINKLIAYMKLLMINATDRNTINHDNYQFYFNKLLSLKGIKIQNDVSTQEVVKADGLRFASTVLSIIIAAFMIYNYLNPDTTVRKAGHVATAASNRFNRTNTLLNYGFGEDQGTCFADKRSCSTDRDQDLEHERERNPIQEYIDLRSSFTDEEVGILNKEGRRHLNRLYGDNE